MSVRQLSPPVYGIETEYSCMITLPGNTVHELVGSCHSFDGKVDLYHQPDSRGSGLITGDMWSMVLGEISLTRNRHGMLSNGGRFYMDPSGPEYCSPETRTAEEAVHRTFDGDEIVLQAFERLRQHEFIEGYQINRRVVDHNRTSRGIHLNTMTTLPDTPSLEAQRQLAALNVAKGAIFGSGGLLLDDKGRTAYHHSPRLSLTTDVAYGYVGYTRRPLVRLPFKEDGGFNRIETVSSDALNFAWPLRASLVVTNALVGIIELGLGTGLPVLRDPVKAARTVGLWGNANQIAVDRPGGYHVGVRPLDLMRKICETVLQVDSQLGHLDKESRQVIPEIIEVADRMTADPGSVANQVESIGRLMAMRMKMDKNKIKLNSEKMCRFDYAWDWLGGGIAERLRHKNMAGWQGFTSTHSAIATRKRLTTPPQDTRAKLRGALIKKEGVNNTSTWGMLDDKDETTYVDPLSTQIPA